MLSCDTLSTGLEMKEKMFSGAQKACELEETAHRWVFLGNSGTGNSKEPLVCLAFVSCRVCPASRNIEITAARHERKNYFRAQRVFDWKRMFTAESLWEILEQEIRQNFNILSCRS